MVNVGLNWRAWRGWYYSAQGDALCWICRPFGARICGGTGRCLVLDMSPLWGWDLWGI
ncbi:MAG: hypothetical protein RIR11_2796 [Bacteroidota bacterium]|jgi:hypothetical protein